MVISTAEAQLKFFNLKSGQQELPCSNYFLNKLEVLINKDIKSLKSTKNKPYLNYEHLFIHRTILKNLINDLKLSDKSLIHDLYYDARENKLQPMNSIYAIIDNVLKNNFNLDHAQIIAAYLKNQYDLKLDNLNKKIADFY